MFLPKEIPEKPVRILMANAKRSDPSFFIPKTTNKMRNSPTVWKEAINPSDTK